MTDRRIRIDAGGVGVTATLNDSPCARAFWEALPIRARAQIWGDEIYFGIPLHAGPDPEWSAETVELGCIGYWPPGNALCLFYGPTPMSRGNEIRPASAVNLLGAMEGDPRVLKRVRDGMTVVVEREVTEAAGPGREADGRDGD